MCSAHIVADDLQVYGQLSHDDLDEDNQQLTQAVRAVAGRAATIALRLNTGNQKHYFLVQSTRLLYGKLGICLGLRCRTVRGFPLSTLSQTSAL